MLNVELEPSAPRARIVWRIQEVRVLPQRQCESKQSAAITARLTWLRMRRDLVGRQHDESPYPTLPRIIKAYA